MMLDLIKKCIELNVKQGASCLEYNTTIKEMYFFFWTKHHKKGNWEF